METTIDTSTKQKESISVVRERAGTLSEGGMSQQEARQGQAALPTHKACVLQGVLMLPTHANHLNHQPSWFKLYLLQNLAAVKTAVIQHKLCPTAQADQLLSRPLQFYSDK